MKVLSVVLACLTLAACSGGGSNSNSSSESVAINGAGVKGPLANAEVNLYALDYAAADLKGSLLDEGETGSNAAITGLTVPAGRTGLVMLEFIVDADTVEINTGLAPVFDRLVTVIDVQRLYDGEAVYASPLTTLAVEIAIANADQNTPFNGNGDGDITAAEFTDALEVARRLVTGSLGFGMPTSIDIFTTPPLITDTTVTVDAQAEVASYRQAIEALAALTIILSGDTTATDTPADLLAALAEDLGDGDIDGEGKQGVVAAYLSLTEDVDTQASEMDLDTITVPGTSDPISDIESVLVSEKAVSGSTTDTSALEDGSVEVELNAPVLAPDVSASPTPDTTDSDSDGVRDELDADDDNDGVKDIDDAFPFDASESKDTDGDGTGDNSDPEPYPAVTFTTPVEFYVEVGEQKQNAAQTTPANNFVYESSDETVAVVDSQGRVTGVSEGTAMISASIIDTPATLTTASYAVNVYTSCGSCNTYQRIFDDAVYDGAIDMFDQADGKIVMLARAASKTNPISGNAILSRINPDGSLDATFGTLGQTSIKPSGPTYFAAKEMAVQSDGKILVLAHTDTGGLNHAGYVMRFTADGVLDTSFGTGGIYIHTYVSDDWSVRNLSVDGADNIFVSMINRVTNTHSEFFRLSANGVLDTSWASSGLLSLSSFTVWSIEALDNGKLIAAATQGDYFVVRQFNADGSLDTDFGVAGELAQYVGGSGKLIEQVLMLADGGMLILGYSNINGRKDTILIRTDANGIPVADFGSSGLLQLTFEGKDSYPYAVLEQTDGKFVVVGSTGDFAEDNNAFLARLNIDGSFDSTLPALNSASNGIVIHDLAYEAFSDVAYNINMATTVLRRANGGYLLLNIVQITQHAGSAVYYAFADTHLVGLDENGALDNNSFIATGFANEVITDFDGDTIRDRIDIDDDNDGIDDGVDPYPYDTDNDGLDNDVDLDDDGDGINDADDAYPLDLDNDGISNVSDGDDDGDGLSDLYDDFPLDPTEKYDSDNDGIGDNADPTPYPALTFALSGDQAMGLYDVVSNPATPSVSTGGRSIQYESSDTDVVTVDANGDVTAVGLGTATISADISGWVDTPTTYQVTVTPCASCASSTVEINVSNIQEFRGVVELADTDLFVFGSNGFYSASAVARFRFEGTVDPDFNGGSALQFNYAAGALTLVVDAAEQSDGKILLLSELQNPSGSDTSFLVSRLNTDGSLDTSYGVSGHFVWSSTGEDLIPGRMVLQSDDKLVVVGTRVSGGNQSAVIRLTDTGVLDTSFGDSGSGISQSLGDGSLTDVVLDGSDIVAAGLTTAGNDALLLRLDSNGALDTSFNGTGKALHNLGGDIVYIDPDRATQGVRTVVQSTGQYLLAGTVGSNAEEMFIARYNANGVLDTSFGSAGESRQSHGSYCVANDLIEQADGTLVVVGSAQDSTPFFLDVVTMWRFDSSGNFESLALADANIDSNDSALGMSVIESTFGGQIISVTSYDSVFGTPQARLLGVNDDGTENTNRFR